MATLVGVVERPQQLDAQAWVATLRVERVLAGDAQPGAQMRIAWEELAPSRPVRFSDGERIAVALDPLPDWSIWRQRLPARDAMAVAERGDAFLRDPDPRNAALLSGYLRLTPQQRKDLPGVAALAALLEEGVHSLAQAALKRLDEVPALAARLDPKARDALARVAEEEQRPLALRRELIELTARRKLAALRPSLDRLARPGSPLEAAALEAQALLDGGLPVERVRVLLARAEPEVRAVAVRFAPPQLEPDPAATRVGSDPSPLVRAAAASALVERRGLDAFDRVAAALFDAEASVRIAAAEALGGLGAGVVPQLVALVEGRSAPEASGPILALSRAGPEGTAALGVIANTHPDEKVRKLVFFVLGRDPGRH